ncbi:putative membrane protein [Desulfobaculum xiamenense]|uniref:Putative membrane protein n=1 Tax=Desulfobaculum xiamenense TaxID=995050 RepID=A0A846QU33_9BACT|nr:DUF502 domain-containing protein [Desulfobaculum xiamenense]NJB68149.1 putative membrane protein [Desulfobaculum xiamenense]
MFRTLLRHIKDALKANLLAGILVVTPLAATGFFLSLLFKWGDKVLLLIPEPYRPEQYLPFKVPGLGIIILFMFLFLAGVLGRNILGRFVVRIGEALLNNIPLVNKFYNAVKQLVNTILNGGNKDFKRVVLIEFPRKGIWALAYVTGTAVGEIQRRTEKKVVNVFVPTTPNPTSGFYLMVPEEELIPLDMSVEDSFKVLISGGIINPESKQV